MRRFAALSRLEQLTLVLALVLLPVVRLSLTVLGFTATWRWCTAVGRRRSVHARADSDVALAESTMLMVRIAAVRGVCSATCLPRALAAWLILRWQGLDPELTIGARRQGASFDAHAWLMLGSVVLHTNGEPGTEYSAFEGSRCIGKAHPFAA